MEQLLDFVSPGVLWFVALLVIVFTVLIMAALRFHWQEYAVDAQRTDITYRVFTMVAGVLVVMMVLAIVSYSYGS